MMDLFNVGGTFLRRITRYFVRPAPTSEGTFMEEVVETSLSNEGVYETRVSVELDPLDCGHVPHHYNEIGCRCSLCGSLSCLNKCTHVCERCHTTIGNCCTKTFEGKRVCVRCNRILRAKKGALVTCSVSGKALVGTFKVLSIPFKSGRDA